MVVGIVMLVGIVIVVDKAMLVDGVMVVITVLLHTDLMGLGRLGDLFEIGVKKTGLWTGGHQDTGVLLPKEKITSGICVDECHIY